MRRSKARSLGAVLAVVGLLAGAFGGSLRWLSGKPVQNPTSPDPENVVRLRAR